MRYLSSTLVLVLCIYCSPAWADHAAPNTAQYSSAISRLVNHGGFLVQKGTSTFAVHNPGTSFIPASIIKIATSLAAIKILGPSYRFETAFYRDQQDNLYIKGYGDPFLVSEEVALIINRLRANGVKRINNIILDDSAYQLESATVDGAGNSLNPYDVMNGGLSVNFNTVYVTVSPDGTIASAEPQTPTLPLMNKLAANMKSGDHRFNISKERINVLQYVGELFRSLQQGQQIPGDGKILIGKVPADLHPVYVNRSTKDMENSIRDLMLYSNNFIANQIFLACGTKKLGYPATWEKGKKVLKEFLNMELGLTQDMIFMVEGAGLSRRNRVTPQAMAAILEAFKPYARLLPVEQNRFIKSGTLTGVYSYAGYFQNGTKLDSFVLILNQKKNTRDRLLDVLEKVYRRN